MNAWTICLGFNDLEEPFSDPKIRRAIGYAIDREQLVEIGWHGSGSYALLPFPDFATMRRFTEPIHDLLEKYEIDVYDLQACARIL
ncbi:MAG: ABC transporter substrate-binding protein [Candidatus Latescibacterota bacterium]